MWTSTTVPELCLTAHPTYYVEVLKYWLVWYWFLLETLKCHKDNWSHLRNLEFNSKPHEKHIQYHWIDSLKSNISQTNHAKVPAVHTITLHLTCRQLPECLTQPVDWFQEHRTESKLSPLNRINSCIPHTIDMQFNLNWIIQHQIVTTTYLKHGKLWSPKDSTSVSLNRTTLFLRVFPRINLTYLQSNSI